MDSSSVHFLNVCKLKFDVYCIFNAFFQVKLTVHAEVMGGTVLEQTFLVEYVINSQMCDDCHRSEAKDYWRACVSSVKVYHERI